MTDYDAEWYYPTGGLATNQRAVVFGPGDDNVLASLFTDGTFTVPLANPTTTTALGRLTFSVQVDGEYWIWVGPINGGHGVSWNSAGGGGGAVLTVNGEGPDGGGNVQLSAADVGADPAGSAAAAAAASQPLATINAAGDLYLGTGNDATTRLPIGAAGEVLTVVAGTANWEPAPSAPVTSVNGETGVVVLSAADVGADPAGSAAAAAAASQPLATINAKGDLYVGTANDTTTRKGVGADGTVLTASAADPTGVAWVTPTADAVTSVNGQTGVVVLDAGDVGAAPTARNLIAGVALSGGGDLSADRTFDVDLGTTAGTAAEGNDTRITGAQQRSTIDAKGDLYVGTANDTTSRLAVGTNGQFLRANSATGTGLEWDTVTAAEVGADTAGSAAAAQAASQPLDTQLTEIAALNPANDDIIQEKGGVLTNRTLAQYKTDLNISPEATVYPAVGFTGWFPSYVTGGSSTSSDLTSGVIVFVPVIIGGPCTLARTAYEITRQSVAAAGTDQLGTAIYASTETFAGRPTGAPLADLGLEDLEQTLGIKVINHSDLVFPSARLVWLGSGRITSGVVTTGGRVRQMSPIKTGLVFEVNAAAPTSVAPGQLAAYSQSGWAGGAMPSVGTLAVVAGGSPGPCYTLELAA